MIATPPSMTTNPAYVGSTVVLLALFFCVSGFSADFPQTSLRLTTFPSHALVFPGTNPHYSDVSLGQTPLHFLTDDSMMTLTLKKQGYADTAFHLTINHEYPINHFSLQLKPLIDSAGDIAHQEWFHQRKQNKQGKIWQYVSLVPALAAATSYALSYYYYRQARQYQKTLDSSLLRNSSVWNTTLHDFSENRKKSDQLRKSGHILGSTSLALFSVGIYLRF